jgi:hypothetical protein
MCEAEDRNKKALFVLQTDWGCGRIDVGRIQSILKGDCEHEEMTHARTG